MKRLTSFGYWLRRRRKALDLTQAALAQRVGCAKSTIRMIETDERRPSRQIAERLAGVLELAPEERAAFIQAARAERAVDQLPPPLQRATEPHPRGPDKDLGPPEQSSQFVTSDLPADSPPARTLHAQATNLPAQRTPLVGRELEIAAVKTLLQQDSVRLVTLTGPGGSGKTRLALQVAAELVAAYTDGVWFVDLTPISDPNLVVTTIAQTLGIPTTSERSTDQLKAALHRRHLLLVLDNYEQVLEAATLVAELLAAAARLTVLVTSRVALHLVGEHEYVVPPLALPPLQGSEAPAPDPPSLSQYAAVRLFIQRARAAKATFAVTSANAPAIAEICIRLDGLPLAIELAAARAKLFSPELLLARLERDGGLGVLTGGARDLPRRQQTIRSTIDWSYNLLSADEQRLFRRLGVFVGGFTINAAAAVGAASSDQRIVVDDRLAALVDHSLVVPHEVAAGEPRYGMLETLREYALEQLREAGEERETRRQHAAYFAAWAEELRAIPGGADLLSADQLAHELDNIRAALAWSLARAGEDARYALRLFGRLWELWFMRYPREGEIIAERALECVSAQQQDLVAARIYNAAARMPKGLADSAYGIALLERSLALARQYDDRRLQAEVLRHLGEALFHHDLQATEQVLRESLQISHELNDDGQEAWTTYGLGEIAKHQGDFIAAERSFQHSLALFARLGHPTSQVFVLRELAYLAEERGDPAAADGYLARAIALADQVGPVMDFSPLFERGQIAYRRGDYQQALELLQAGYDQARQRDHNQLAAHALLWLARCHQERRELAAATECCRQVLALMRENPLPRGRLGILAITTAYTEVIGRQYEEGAWVLGCVAEERAATNYSGDCWWTPEWNHVHDRALATCRAALNETAFRAAWEAGQAMTLEQAIAYALGEREEGVESEEERGSGDSQRRRADRRRLFPTQR